MGPNSLHKRRPPRQEILTAIYADVVQVGNLSRMDLWSTKMDENPGGEEYVWSRLRERRGRRRSGEVETDNLSDPERATEPILVRGDLPAGRSQST
jgi:hypothetical protein